MEWKSNLRRTQSLKSVASSCDKPTWTEAGLREKKASVSQLVARYQTVVEVKQHIQATRVNGEVKLKEELKQITLPPPNVNDLPENEMSREEFLMRRNEMREHSQVKTNLIRSKSMGNLQNSSGSILTLRSMFESNAVTQTKPKTGFKAANFTSSSKRADITAIMNGETEEINAAGELKTHITVDAPENDTNIKAKDDRPFQKVVNQTRAERRKTIAGIDFEKLAAAQADEKRRSIADFRDSYFVQTTEKVSVKAISALYLSKLTSQEPNKSQALERSSELGKRTKLTKMAEDSQPSTDDLLPPPSSRHQPGLQDTGKVSSQPFMQSQPSIEKLHQQRQKSELRRLLKHTHPELKMLDEVVDEELAEVLSSETGVTAAETGYEGEVLSRCLIFEPCAISKKVSSYATNVHMAEGMEQRGNASKISAVFEGVKGVMEAEKTPDPDKVCKEEEIRIDVRSTRRIFEGQSMKTSRPNPDNKLQGKISIYGDETGTVQQKKQESMCVSDKGHSKNKSTHTDATDPAHKKEPCDHIVSKSTDDVFSGWRDIPTEDEFGSSPDAEIFGETIKTSAALFQHNPFISTNVEKEHAYLQTEKSNIPAGDGTVAEDYQTANVKNRAHLFESMPFDKIRQQNKDEIETMVENIKETLKFLYHAKAIHSSGSIIEVNETMIAKKAKFTLTNEGPEIMYNQLAEGGAQNLILQLLPRANIKPQIIYLKEDSKGGMATMVINAPVHQDQFTASQDTEFKTANVVQLIEDILNQDNSLRKGVIIQEEANRCAEVMVYSLYNYFDEEDIKSYCPPQQIDADYDKPETKRADMTETENQGVRHGIVESTINLRGNVKLFKSCIEKGDLEYLKSLQAEATVGDEELPSSHTLAEGNTTIHHEQSSDGAEESTTEYVPVDVKRLKNIFSIDQSQTPPKQSICKNLVLSKSVSKVSAGQYVQHRKSESSTECNIDVFAHEQIKNTRQHGSPTQDDVCNFSVSHHSYLPFDARENDIIHQAEVVEVVDDCEEITSLQTAIHNLQQATVEAKTIYHSLQEKQEKLQSSQVSSEKTIVSVTCDGKSSTPVKTDADLPQGSHHKEDLCVRTRWDESHEGPSSASVSAEHKLDCRQACHKEMQFEARQTTDSWSESSTEMVQEPEFAAAMVSTNNLKPNPAEEEAEEVSLHGKLQAALDSLERSNINVSRGDFRAAMIYRSSKPHIEKSQNVDGSSVKAIDTALYTVTHEMVTEEVQAAKAGSLKAFQSETQNRSDMCAATEKSKRPLGPKPAIPPKPEHLQLKQRENQLNNPEYPGAIKTNSTQPEVKKQHTEETDPQPVKTAAKPSDNKHEVSKTTGDADSGSDSLTHSSSYCIEISPKTEIKALPINLNSSNADTHNQQEAVNARAEDKINQIIPVKESMNETDESHVDFHEARKKFGGKKAPVKPKRVKIALPDNKSLKQTSGEENSSTVQAHVNVESQQARIVTSSNKPKTCGQISDSKDKDKKENKQDRKVEMREKKVRHETEDERRQRLSIHMDEIMRGNTTAAMEIFDNLRKQEELQSILNRVEEIEQDTSEVDVQSLRKVFENVRDWVVNSDKKKQKMIKAQLREEGKSALPKENTEAVSTRLSRDVFSLFEASLSNGKSNCR
ncbi:xin actin-binding repeat-containing protein 1 [Sphaeramia orbicularis]|uniref:xin actin-binding repeat-containing protein 1 n=1 Tax=Sphaeramia orbicularis TaxID=375764 RepID=UPI00117DEAC7|nr:xin actin-binding repeat-containing protein 1-like [Sphaeramia orbicularis]